MTNRLILLGTAAAVPDPAHETVYMAIDSPGGAVLIDCAGSPLIRLQQAGIEPARLRAVVITHFHPDHVYGLPLLLLDLWLTGRRERLPIIGLRHALERTRAMMELYEWQTWNGFYPVDFIEVMPEQDAPILETDDLILYAAPVRHIIPCIAVKMVSQHTGASIVYTSDTEPCQSIPRLAQKAGVLIHEATGAFPGHSTPTMAGAMARQAQVDRLILIHYPSDAPPAWLAQARQSFDGPIELAQDFQVIKF